MIALVAALVGGVYVLSSTGNKRTIVGYFTSAVGLYPGDQVRVLGVPVGEIDMIEPRSSDVKITMSVSKDVKVPVDVQAVIMSPNLVAARFIQLTPVYTGGAVLPDNGRIDLDRTAVPVEWDEVKEGLTRLAADLSPAAGELQGRWARRSTRPRTPLTATETRYTTRCASLRRSPGGWGFARRHLRHRQEPAGTGRRAIGERRADCAVRRPRGIGVAGARRQLGQSGPDPGHAQPGAVRHQGFLRENNSTLIETVNQLNDFAQTLSDQSENIEQVLHVAGPGITNFYNIYDPAQGTLNGLLSIPNFANPVQFICGGSFDTAAGRRRRTTTGAPRSAVSGWGRCCAGSR